MGLNRVCLCSLWLSPAPWYRFFFYKILTYVCLYLCMCMLESVGSGLRLPRLNPVLPPPPTFPTFW